MASTAVTKVYFKYFADHTDIIAQNVNLGPKGILGQLLDEEVIDEKCTTDIAKLSLTDKEKRGNELVYYLLNENNVDKYEGFLKIWEKKNPDEAGDLRMNIYELLSSQGQKVPERWAKKPANVSKQPESVVAEPKASPSDVPSKKEVSAPNSKVNVWKTSCWQTYLQRHTRDLLESLNLDSGSSLVLDALLSREVLTKADYRSINSEKNPNEKNRLFIQSLEKMNEEGVREVIKAFQEDLNTMWIILQNLLDQALKDM